MSEDTREGSEPPRPAPAEASPLAADSPSPPDTRVSLAEFLACESLAQLEQLYRERGAEQTGAALRKEMRREWNAVAMAEAHRTLADPPARLEPLEVERDGVTYAIYGVIHGLVGGHDRDYKELVNAALRELPHTVFEDGFGWFYPSQSAETIPDQTVAGFLGAVRIGLYVGIEFPLMLLELVAELLKLKLPFGGAEGDLLDYDARFHTLDPEVRRGVEPDPPLPSRVQIDLELQDWDAHGWLAGWKEPGAIVPRSMFMAGYAVGVSERRGVSRVDLVIGDLHTMEVVRFLEDPRWAEHPVFAAGRRLALRSAVSREVRRLAAKARHLGVAGLVGCLILVPALVFVLWLFGVYDTLMPWWSGGKL